MIFYFFIFQILINFFLIKYFNIISKKINLFDIPDQVRKIHKEKVAPIGGVIIIFNLLIFLIYNFINYFLIKNDLLNFKFDEIIFFYLFIFLFFLIGFVDDKLNISSTKKLFIFSLNIFLFLSINNTYEIERLNFSFFSKTIDITYISFLFTILCYLLFINAFNMYDGINLQSGLYAVFIFFIFLYKGIYVEISILIIISLIFFLYLNLKNKCFFGDNGSLLVSSIICYFFVKSSTTNNLFFADEIFLIMLIPGIELLRLAFFRLLKGKHPFSPDRNHIHHILLKNFGFTKTIIILNLIVILPYLFFIIFKQIILIICFTLFIYSYLVIKYSTQINNK
jgi:UDP-GlcNAc:undecaprenyl-phosphate GlcNAc-1-phosphate transferase